MKAINTCSVIFSIFIITSLILTSCASACVSPTSLEPVVITLFDKDRHLGIDIEAQAGSSVFAIAPGRVYWIGTMPNGIRCISIADEDGLRTTYLPVAVDKRFSSWREEDVFVEAGEKLGTLELGDRSCDYDHLHLGLKTGRGREARYLDPLEYFDFEWSAAACPSGSIEPDGQAAVIEYPTATLPPPSLTGMEPEPEPSISESEPEPSAGEIPEPEPEPDSNIEYEVLSPDPSSSLVGEGKPEQEISPVGETAAIESPECTIAPFVQPEQLPSPGTPASSEAQIINEPYREALATVASRPITKPMAAESACALPPAPVGYIATPKTGSAPRQTEVMPEDKPASHETSTKLPRHRPDAVYHKAGNAIHPLFLLPVTLGVILRRRLTNILYESFAATKAVLTRTGRIIALNASMSLPGPG